MSSSWKAVYPWIQAALTTCQSPEDFCEQAIAQIAATYNCGGWLWVGLENPETVQVYRTHDESPEPKNTALPDGMSWLTDQHPSLQITQLHTGDLVIPVMHPIEPVITAGDAVVRQMALQLRRTSISDTASKPAILLTDNRAQTAVFGWSAEELNSLEILASQIGLAYELFQARQQVHYSRQQIALLSRTAYILNSTLPLEAQMLRLLGDWGHCTGSDRGFVMHSQNRTLVPIATWNMESSQDLGLDEETLWQDAIDLFEDGAASHLELYPAIAVDEDDILQQWLTKQGCESGILMPIRIQGQFFGIVGLLSTLARPNYRVDELQILRQATEQLAIALGALYSPPERLPEPWGDSKALYDSLTGCETRAALEQALQQVRTRVDWATTATSLILCNLDYFKLVNDTYGHNVGDQVLQAIAHRLREHLRHPSKVYRYGGEEFAILLTDTPHSAAIRVAERLRWAIGETPIRTSAGEVSVTASFGVAQQPTTREEDDWVMIQDAEAAVQEAKRQGRNQVIG